MSDFKFNSRDPRTLLMQQALHFTLTQAQSPTFLQHTLKAAVLTALLPPSAAGSQPGHSYLGTKQDTQELVSPHLAKAASGIPVHLQ